jgi:hypothetical protein
MVLEMGNGVSLDYHDFYSPDGEILPQHLLEIITRPYGSGDVPS